jgi:hypothetical protein
MNTSHEQQLSEVQLSSRRQRIVRGVCCHLLRTRFAPIAALAALLVACLAAASQAAVRIEAYQGEPFGVGRITVDLPQDGSTAPGGDDRFAVADDQGRVVYPVLEQRRFGRLLRDFLGIDLPGRATFYFLFRGNAPLNLTVYAPTAQHFTVTPEQKENQFQRRFDDWWKTYTGHYDQVAHDAEYPIEVENYLTANWARRLGRDMPEPSLQLFGQRKIGGSWIAQLTANESYEALVERDLVLGRYDGSQAATLSLPESPRSTSGVAGDEPKRAPSVKPTDIEPLATHVPRECFYERFGSFPNYLWYRDFLHHWQNDLGNMVTLRSINHASRDRLQDQLAVHESSVARAWGPKVIHDVAFVGFDYYMRDGAALGIMFQANNNLLLSQDFNGERSKAVDKHPGAKLETVSIAGHDVAYLSTPDGRLRSYYAVDGDFHLITTSRHLVERFYAAPSDGTSLAATAEFQNTRAQMPITRDDTIFLYLSSPFLDHLASPAYRVELDRRLRSIGEIRALELARMTAKAEGSTANSIDELISTKLLPSGFGKRADGSQLIADENGYHDSVRGIPGWFMPVSDVPVERITPAEAAHLSAFQHSIDSEVGRFVPVVAAVQRLVSEDGKLDRIAGEVHVAPYSQTKMEGWVRMLGPAEANRVAPINGDIASLEVVMDALGQSVHVFGGLRDFRTPLVVRQGEARPAMSPSEFVRGYVGTWPRPLALLETFLGGATGPPDAQGVSPNNGLFNLWTRRAGDFFLLSFHRDVLLEVGPQLAMVEAERPAQIRLHIDDLSDKQIATGVNGLGYMRMRSASASGSRFMNSLTSELHVPPEHAREIAERLVDGRLVDPLGGDYTLVDAVSRDAQRSAPDAQQSASAVSRDPKGIAPDTRKLWASTATSTENKFLLTEIPADYTMPLMTWFRGLTLEVSRDDGADALTARANLDMVHIDVTPPAEEGESTSFLGGLLGGWGSAKSADAKPAEKKEDLPTPK